MTGIPAADEHTFKVEVGDPRYCWNPVRHQLHRFEYQTADTTGGYLCMGDGEMAAHLLKVNIDPEPITLPKIEGQLISYLAGRWEKHARNVRETLAALTLMEQRLLREVAVMAYVQGTFAGRDRRVPPDSTIVYRVVDACLAMDDKWPILHGVRENAARWRTFEPTGEAVALASQPGKGPDPATQQEEESRRYDQVYSQGVAWLDSPAGQLWWDGDGVTREHLFDRELARLDPDDHLAWMDGVKGVAWHRTHPGQICGLAQRAGQCPHGCLTPM